MGDGRRKSDRERESYEKWYETRAGEKWKAGKIGRGTDTGLFEEARWESDKKKRRNVVCAITADASQVMIVLSSSRRYAHADSHTGFLKGVDRKMFYFIGQTSTVCMFIIAMQHLSLSFP